MDVKPIKTKKDYKAALDKIASLMPSRPHTPESDLLEVLTILVKSYEVTHHKIDFSDPIEAIKFRLEQERLSRKDLESILNISRGRVSELLTKRRALTLRMIRTIHNKLGIPTEILLQEYPLRK